MTLFEENNESLFEESSNNEINLLQKELSVELQLLRRTAIRWRVQHRLLLRIKLNRRLKAEESPLFRSKIK